MVRAHGSWEWPGGTWHRRAASYVPKLILAALLLAAGGAAGYLAARDLPFGHGTPGKTGAEDGPVPPDPGEAPSSWQPATGPLTTLVFKTFYSRCGGETTRTEPAGTALAGLTRTQVSQRFPGWQVDVFRPGQVVLTRIESGPCPDEAWFRTIGLQDGRVVVFAGRSGNRGPVLQDTGIHVDRLLPADRAKLEKGVEVQGDAGVWQFLEGLE